MNQERTYTAFAGPQLVASGDVRSVVRRAKASLEQGGPEPVLVFEDETGAQIDFDFHGTEGEVLQKLESHPLFARFSGASGAANESDATARRAGPGRPKLGVIGREVTLLPRHWEWLEHQPGGASVALRKLVEEARKRGQGQDRARLAWEAAGKFMWVMAGDLHDFEEASRALYAKDPAGLARRTRTWPADIRAHLTRLVEHAVRSSELAKTGDTPQEPA